MKKNIERDRGHVPRLHVSSRATSDTTFRNFVGYSYDTVRPLSKRWQEMMMAV
jgi:hypothetical protein